MIFKQLLIVILVSFDLFIDPNHDKVENQEVNGPVERLLLRQLSHKCWWKDYLCCQNTLRQCIVCDTVCGPSTYTQGVYGGANCCCGSGQCTKKAGTPSGTFSCELKPNPSTGGTITKTFTRNQGAQLFVINDYTDLFTPPNPSLCGSYLCTNMVYKSGVDQMSCMTTEPNEGKSFNANTCTKFGTGVYTYTCSAVPAFTVSFDPINIIFNDYCDLAGTVTSLTPPSLSLLVDGNTASTSNSFLSAFFTITQAQCLMTSCSIVTATAGVCNAGTVAYFTASLIAASSPQQVQYTVDTSALRAQAQYCLKCDTNELTPKTFHSDPFTMEVVCGPATNAVTNNGAFQQKISEIPDGTTPTFPVQAFILSVPACPITQIDFFTEDKLTSPPTNMLPAGFAASNINYQVSFITTDFTTIKDYKFKIRLSLQGGQLVWVNFGGDETMVLSVTCPDNQSNIVNGNPIVVVTQDPNLVTQVKLYINGQNTDIYTFLPPTNSHELSCPIVKYEVINIKKDSQPLSTAIVPAASCGAAPFCVKFDSHSLTHIQVISFQIKTTIEGGLEHVSSNVQVDVYCNKASATITPSIFEKKITIVQYETGITYFPPFNCSPLDCCKNLKYTVSSANTLPALSSIYVSQKPVLVTDSTSENLGNYYMELITGQMGNFQYYIHVENQWGAYAYSLAVNVTVVYNCKYDKMWHETAKPKDGIFPELVQWNNLNATTDRYNASVSGAWLVANYTLRTTSLNDIRFNLKDRLHSNASAYCPILHYMIQSIVDASTGKPLSNHIAELTMVMYENATIDLFGVNNVVKYFVWVKMWNGKVYLTHPLPALVVNTSLPHERVPNFTPFFETEIAAHHKINVTEYRSQGKDYFIEVPKVLDANFGDTWDISFEPKKKYISFSAEKGIVFNSSKFDEMDLGNQFIQLLLSDNNGATKKYILLFTFIESLYTPPELFKPEIIEKEIRVASPNQNLTAYIESISVFGEMRIKFNTTINMDFNMSHVNNSLVDMYVEPYGRSPDYNMTKLNFTWTLVNVSNYYHDYKIKWFHPLEISPYVIQDTFVFHLKNDSKAFFSEKINNYLHEESWVMKKNIRRNLNDEKVTRSVIANANSGASFTLSLLILAFLFNIMASNKGFRYYRWYLRGVQLVCHLPMLKVSVPGNVSSFYENLIPFVQFDMMGSDWTTELIFDFDFPQHRELMSKRPNFGQMQNLGYETFSSILTLGSIWLMSCAFILSLNIYTVFWLIRKYSNGKYKFKFLEKVEEKLFFYDLLSLAIDGYMEWTIAGYLNITNPIYTYGGDIASNISGIVSLAVCLFLVPVSLLVLLFPPIEYLQQPKFRKLFGFFFEDIKVKNKFYSSFFFFWILRRLIFIFSFAYIDVPSIQMITNLWTNLFFAIQAGLYPYNDKHLNKHGLVEEFLIQLQFLHMCLFTDWVTSAEDQNFFGWSMIGITTMHLIYQSTQLVYHILLQIIQYAIKYKRIGQYKYDVYKGYDPKSYIDLVRQFKIKQLAEKIEVIQTESKQEEQKKEIKPIRPPVLTQNIKKIQPFIKRKELVDEKTKLDQSIIRTPRFGKDKSRAPEKKRHDKSSSPEKKSKSKHRDNSKEERKTPNRPSEKKRKSSKGSKSPRRPDIQKEAKGLPDDQLISVFNPKLLNLEDLQKLREKVLKQPLPAPPRKSRAPDDLISPIQAAFGRK